MKEFACGQLIPGCKALFSYASDEELLHAVAAHARADHGIEPGPDLVDQVRARIVTVG
jgi:predicted small metal-binding protein